MPPCWPFAGSLAKEDVLPAEYVEVEAAEGEDGVVEVVLIFESKFGEGVVGHNAIVVRAS